MDIKKIADSFNEKAREIIRNYDETIGLRIIKTYVKLGNVSYLTYLKRNSDDFNNMELFEELISLQTYCSMIYENFKIRNPKVRDFHFFKAVDGNYSKIVQEGTGIKDEVWILFKLYNFLGKVNENFTIRTTPNDDETRSKYMTVVFAYMMRYIELFMEKYNIPMTELTSRIEKINIDTTNLRKIEYGDVTFDKEIEEKEEKEESLEKYIPQLNEDKTKELEKKIEEEMNNVDVKNIDVKSQSKKTTVIKKPPLPEGLDPQKIAKKMKDMGF